MFATEQRALPAISGPACGIYNGKYMDRTPDITAAGKLTSSGYDAKSCLSTQTRPQSPEAVRRFRESMQPDAGRMRVFYSKAYDPHRRWANEMVHGTRLDPSYTAGELLNPRPKSLYQQRILDKKEALYHSHIKYPLGVSHDQRANMPPELDPSRVTFGIKTFKDGSAGELVTPDKTYGEVDQEYAVGHDIYVRSHRSYSAGEQLRRDYRSPHYRPLSCFGIPTPHANDGRHVRKTMKWLTDLQAEKATPISNKRLDDFRERTQPQLGRVHDPIKDTMHVENDHTFGILFKPDQYGAGDLLHCRPPGTYLRGRERMRGILAAIRQNLKKANYHNFQGLLQAFQFYDKDKSGKVSITGLRDACLQFDLPVETELLVQLLDTCDLNRDGLVDYTEFANFLNWKDKFPDSDEFPREKVPSGCQPTSGEEGPLGTPQLSTPRRLEMQIDRAITNQRTSASMINAVVGGVSTAQYRKYGTPTIRSDLPAPLTKRVSDHTNYGDESDAHGLMHPSIYNQHGVDERDFLGPRSKDELKRVLAAMGVLMTGESFEQIYQKATEIHPKGFVSVESFRAILDQLSAQGCAQ